MLLAGKPTLQVPIFLEQALFSQAAAHLRGNRRPAHKPLEAVTGLMELLGSQRHAEGCGEFAWRHAGDATERQIAAMVDRAEELLRLE